MNRVPNFSIQTQPERFLPPSSFQSVPFDVLRNHAYATTRWLTARKTYPPSTLVCVPHMILSFRCNSKNHFRRWLCNMMSRSSTGRHNNSKNQDGDENFWHYHFSLHRHYTTCEDISAQELRINCFVDHFFSFFYIRPIASSRFAECMEWVKVEKLFTRLDIRSSVNTDASFSVVVFI